MGMGEGEEGGSQILSEDAAEQRRDGMRFLGRPSPAGRRPRQTEAALHFSRVPPALLSYFLQNWVPTSSMVATSEHGAAGGDGGVDGA